MQIGDSLVDHVPPKGAFGAHRHRALYWHIQRAEGLEHYLTAKMCFFLLFRFFCCCWTEGLSTLKCSLYRMCRALPIYAIMLP